MNAVKPKDEFTVADIRNAVLLVNHPTFLSSTPTNEELAALCILCKFLVQGIRAHEIFSGNTDGMDKIKKFYDGLKYSVFNENGVFTKKSIKHGDTSYDIPTNFLTKKAKGEITPYMKKSIKELVYGLALLFSNKYISTGFNKGATGDKPIEFQTRPTFGWNSMFDRNTQTFNFKKNAPIEKNIMLGKIKTKMDDDNVVRIWYTNWVKMYNLFFPGEGCGIHIDYDTAPPIKTDNIVGKFSNSQSGGKSRARTKRAMRGSTKCKTLRKQRKQHKQHKATRCNRKQRKTQHKQRKQRNATHCK